MDLEYYVLSKRLNYETLSKLVGCSRTHLNLIARGKSKAGRQLAKIIELVTNGEVTIEDIREKYERSKKNIDEIDDE